MQTKGTLSRGCIVARPANSSRFSWNLYKMPNYLFWNVWFPNILLKFYLNKHKLKEILQFTRKNMYTAKNIAISTIIWAGNKICSQQDRDISCNFLIIHYLQVWLSQRVYSPKGLCARVYFLRVCGHRTSYYHPWTTVFSSVWLN